MGFNLGVRIYTPSTSFNTCLTNPFPLSSRDRIKDLFGKVEVAVGNLLNIKNMKEDGLAKQQAASSKKTTHTSTSRPFMRYLSQWLT